MWATTMKTVGVVRIARPETILFETDHGGVDGTDMDCLLADQTL